jgi:hypothetical protein
MKEFFFLVVMAAWIAVCGWAVEKIGNLIPDRTMRMLTKFLLFVLFFTMPLLHIAARSAESDASVKRDEQNAQQGVVPSGHAKNRKGLQ